MGRAKEIERALTLLDPSQPTWMLHFVGDGGIGKTKLLEILGLVFAERGCVVPALIDLYDFANQTQDGLLDSLSRQLGSGNFPRFSISQGQRPTTLEDAHEYEQEQIAAFVADYSELTKNSPQIVLRFDTLENIPRQDFAAWLLETFLPNLYEHPIILTAGREPIPPEYLRDYFVQYDLEGITRADATEYVRQRFASQGLPELIDPETLDKIYELAEGRPILLALAVDWSILNADVSQLIAVPKEEFEREMVSWVRELPTRVNAAILHMAVVYKRCDSQILAHLMDLTLEEAESVLTQLRSLAFVKYRADLHEYALHDEMRYLIGKYAAYPLATRQVIARKAAEIYQVKITQTKDPIERRTLEIEAIYYMLNSDLQIAQVFPKAIKLFTEYGQRSVVDFCRLILEVIESHVAKLTPDQFDELEISRARLALYRHDYTQARSILDMIRRQDQISNNVQFDIYNILGSIEEGSNLPQALKYQLQSLTLLEQILAQLDLEAPQRVDFRRNQALIYRKIATLSASLGEYDSARSWNEQSLRIEEDMANIGGIAACLNNIANLDRQRGDYKRAREQAHKALVLRQSLGEQQSKSVGFSWSTIGMIERDAGNFDLAVTHFDLASKVFDDKDEVEYAKALANLGNIYHWREVHLTVGTTQDLDDNSAVSAPTVGEGEIHLELEHYLRQEWPSIFKLFRRSNSELKKRADQSSTFLERSERILRRRKRRADLARTLNYKGRLWIHRSEWWNAKAAFEESLKEARTVGAEPLVIDGLVCLILVNYLLNLSDLVAPITEQIYAITATRGRRYAELLNRMELICGNIDFEAALSEHSEQFYRQAMAHYAEACAHALLFSRSDFEAARYVLRDRLQRIQPEFIAILCDDLSRFWYHDSRDLPKLDTSFLDTVHDVRRQKLPEQDT